MMRMNNINMTTKVPRLKLMETLRINLKRHFQIVQEARDGYIVKAKRALEHRLEQLRKGELVSLSFSLSPPQDYSEVYKNALSMLEWNTSEEVVLHADEFRQLVMDEWDWRNNFLMSNSHYSKTASDLVKQKSNDDEADPGF